MRLRVNKGRNKYMEVTIKATGQKIFKVINYEYEYVKEFKYAGTLLTNGNRITNET
jgi:hypothetical protein